MLVTTLLVSFAFAQEPVVPAASTVRTPPVVDIVSDRPLRQAGRLVIGGRATFAASAAVFGTSAVILGASLPGALNAEAGEALPWGGVGVGFVGVGLGAVGMLVGGTVWGVGEAQQHRLQVTVAPTGNGMVVAGRF